MRRSLLAEKTGQNAPRGRTGRERGLLGFGVACLGCLAVVGVGFGVSCFSPLGTDDGTRGWYIGCFEPDQPKPQGVRFFRDAGGMQGVEIILPPRFHWMAARY